jgi:hypothetical protein
LKSDPWENLTGQGGKNCFGAESNYAARKIYDSYQPKTDYILYNVST